MNDKSISVVIPAYNAELTIKKVIQAVLDQTKTVFIKEIIVVNDGSQDDTKTIVEGLSKDSAIPIAFLTQENQGVSVARNNGMRKATGEWIALCDSDDLWFENKIEEQAKAIDENEEIDFLGCAHQDKILKIGFTSITSLHKGIVKEILLKNYPQPSTVLFKKKIFEELGGFDEKQRYAEDGNWFLKICAKYNLFYLPKQLVYYGEGKQGFGESGLSANLKAMYVGNIKNLDEMFASNNINVIEYLMFRAMYWLKYVRRIVLTKVK